MYVSSHFDKSVCSLAEARGQRDQQNLAGPPNRGPIYRSMLQTLPRWCHDHIYYGPASSCGIGHDCSLVHSALQLRSLILCLSVVWRTYTASSLCSNTPAMWRLTSRITCSRGGVCLHTACGSAIVQRVTVCFSFGLERIRT